jgi:hypothetical protein
MTASDHVVSVGAQIVDGVVVSACPYCHAVEVVCEKCGKLFVLKRGFGERAHVCLSK